MEKEKKVVVMIIVAIIISALVLAGLVYYLAFNSSAGINDFSYEVISSEEGKRIRLTVETEGGSLLGGKPSYQFSTIFGAGGGGGGNIWDDHQDGEYIKYFGPYDEGAKVWIMIYVDTGNDIDWEDFMVTIGDEPDSSEEHDLSIEDISGLPDSMELNEESDISIEIKGTHEGTRVKLDIMYAYRYDAFLGSGSGGGTSGSMVRPEYDPGSGNYRSTISPGQWGLYTDTPSSYSGVFLFRISCYDENRRVVSETIVVTLSD